MSSKPTARVDVAVDDSPHTIKLERREFLRLAVGSGLAVAGSVLLPGLASSQAGDVDAAATSANPVADMAAALDHDLEQIFRFVHEQIRYEPYEGVLRGAKGTLVSGAGNSADQALLLAELLKASSIPVRYVKGELDPSEVTALLASTVTDAATARAQLLEALVSDTDIAAGVRALVPSGASTASPAPGSVVSGQNLAELREVIRADMDAVGPVAAQQLETSVDTIMSVLTDGGIFPSQLRDGYPLARAACPHMGTGG